MLDMMKKMDNLVGWVVKIYFENICILFSDMKCNVNKNNYLL